MNLFIDAGSDYSIEITIFGSSGQPYNLTGHTVKSQFRRSATSSTAYTFTASVIDPANGKIRLELPGVFSDLIDPIRYVYDVEVTNLNTNITTRVLEGDVTITASITRDDSSAWPEIIQGPIGPTGPCLLYTSDAADE